MYPLVVCITNTIHSRTTTRHGSVDGGRIYLFWYDRIFVYLYAQTRLRISQTHTSMILHQRACICYTLVCGDRREDQRVRTHLSKILDRSIWTVDGDHEHRLTHETQVFANGHLMNIRDIARYQYLWPTKRIQAPY